jgi:hypothetical protein
MFRLHLDLPLKISETESAEITKAFVEFLTQNKDTLTNMGIADINYRLGHDDDRQKSNYMIKNHNGHVANKKSRIHLIPQDPDVEYIGLE